MCGIANSWPGIEQRLSNTWRTQFSHRSLVHHMTIHHIHAGCPVVNRIQVVCIQPLIDHHAIAISVRKVITTALKCTGILPQACCTALDCRCIHIHFNPIEQLHVGNGDLEHFTFSVCCCQWLSCHSDNVGECHSTYGIQQLGNLLLGDVFRSLENEHPDIKPAELAFIWTQITGMLRDQGRLAK